MPSEERRVTRAQHQHRRSPRKAPNTSLSPSKPSFDSSRSTIRSKPTPKPHTSPTRLKTTDVLVRTKHRDDFSPELRSPSPMQKKLLPKSPIAKAIFQKQTQPQSAGKGDERKPGSAERPRGRPRLTDEEKALRAQRTASFCLPRSPRDLGLDSMSCLSSAKRLSLATDLPAVRNQSDFHPCIVCREPTLIRTLESEKRIKDAREKIELDPEALTFEEDPSLACAVCMKYFHLVCAFDEVELQAWALRNRAKFVCPECVRCHRCRQPIFDPGNVQCVHCGHAYHEKCRPQPKAAGATGSPTYEALHRTWTCPACEKKKQDVWKSEPTELVDEKPGASEPHRLQRPSTAAAGDPTKPPEPKKMRMSLCKPGTSKEDTDDDRKPKKRPAAKQQHPPNGPANGPPHSPEKRKKSPRPQRPETDEEFEQNRQDFLTALVRRITPQNAHRSNCIESREPIFTHLTEEYLDEDLLSNEEDDMEYVPYGRIAQFPRYTSATSGTPLSPTSSNSAPFPAGGPKRATSADFHPAYFYGDLVYQPRYYDFLDTILPRTDEAAFCHRCLAAIPSMEQLLQHTPLCTVRHPPGELVYEEGALRVWEIEGVAEKTYCQRLALFAKTFIGSKTVHFEVEGFRFYVLAEMVENDFRLAGYFSKEICPSANNNLSCLLVLPWMQRKQYGLFLIDLSYQLSVRERRIGSPEHPLSDAGLKTYRQYWFAVIMSYLRDKLYDNEPLNLRELREQSGIDTHDLLETMIIADMTFILQDKLQLNIETPLYTTLGSLRRRYVKPGLLKIRSAPANTPFSAYNNN